LAKLRKGATTRQGGTVGRGLDDVPLCPPGSIQVTCSHGLGQIMDVFRLGALGVATRGQNTAGGLKTRNVHRVLLCDASALKAASVQVDVEIGG